MSATKEPAAQPNPPRDLTVACYTFPHYHRTAFNDRKFAAGWTEYLVARGGYPWFPGHAQPKVPLLGELDEREPSTWATYVDLAATAGISAFIWDWYWYDGGPVFHEALEEGFLPAPGRDRVAFAVMWTNHRWVNVKPTVGTTPDIGDELETLFTDQRATRETLALPPQTPEECWRSLSYIIARYFHDPYYWRLAGEPVLVVWDPAELIRVAGGVEEVSLLFSELEAFAGKLGHLGIHFHTPGYQSAPELAAAGFSSFGAYNTLYYSAADHDPSVELIDYARASGHVVEEFWPRLESSSALPFFPSVSPGWDTTPRAVEPRRGPVADRRVWPGTPIVVGDSPNLFEAFVREARAWLQARPDVPPVLTIACWNEFTEGQYLLPDTRFGYGMLRALKRGLTTQS